MEEVSVDGSLDTSVTEDHMDLEEILWKMLVDEDYTLATAEVKKERYKKHIKENCMELIPTLALKLQETTKSEGFDCIEDILLYIANTAASKEVVLSLLSELCSSKGYEQICALLYPLEVSLHRELCATKKNWYLISSFKSIANYMSAMDLPCNYSLEGKERMLLDVDPCVQAVSCLLPRVVDYFQHFKSTIMQEKSKSQSFNSDWYKCICSVMLLLDKPLAYLDIFCDEKKSENSLYRNIERLVTLIVECVGNPYSLFNFIECKFNETSASGEDDDDDEKHILKQISVATFFYCMLSQNMAVDLIPHIYHPHYKFLSLLPFLCQLLGKPEQLAIHKGLLLSQVLIRGLKIETLSDDCLDAPYHYHFNKVLIHCMTMTNDKGMRSLAFSIFQEYLSLFTFDGRYRLLEYLLLSINHAGLAGVVTTEIKQNFLKASTCISRKKNNSTSNKFVGQTLWKLIHLACTLPNGEQTDMLDWSEKILSALNLLLFFFKKGKNLCSDSLDVTFSRSVIVPHLQNIQSTFLEQLQRGLRISQEHYKLKLKDLHENGVDNRDDIVSVNVNDALLPGANVEQEKHVISLALTRLDMILCVFSDVEVAARELFDVCNKLEENALDCA